MKCSKCGKEVKKTDKFCQYCGTKVEAEEKASTVEKTVEKRKETKTEKVEAVKVEEKKSGNGVGIAGMVLGIVGLFFSLIIGPFAFLFTLVGLILSICAKKSGFKVAGIITNSIGIAIQVLWIVAIIFFSSLISAIIGDINYDLEDYDYDLDDYTTYKYASPYGEWTCTPYPSSDYSNKEETTLNFKYSGKYIYGPKGDLDNNHYSGTFTYEREYDKNKQYTDKEFIDVKATVDEALLDGQSQSTIDKNLNMEMEFVNDYNEAYIMFYNTSNTYHCTK